MVFRIIQLYLLFTDLVPSPWGLVIKAALIADGVFIVDDGLMPCQETVTCSKPVGYESKVIFLSFRMFLDSFGLGEGKRNFVLLQSALLFHKVYHKRWNTNQTSYYG